jgi:hypothetical protein
VSLAGTVGSGPSAVAAFRVGEGIVQVRCGSEIAGWRLTRIQGARVWLARGQEQRRIRVGGLLAAASDAGVR